MFHDYFKEELANEESITFSFSKSKSKLKEKKEHITSRPKSQKKPRTEINFGIGENDNNFDTLSAIENMDSYSVITKKSR
jgi:hypothetical protein